MRQRMVVTVMLLAAVGSVLVLKHGVEAPSSARMSLAGQTSPVVPDFVSVNQSRGLDGPAIDALSMYFDSNKLSYTVIHQGTLDMIGVTRQGTVVRSAPVGAGFPMSSLAVDATAIAATMGDVVATVAGGGRIVMGATAATQNSIIPGDMVTLMGWNGVPATFEVGAVEPDPVVSGVEIVMSVESGVPLGFVRPFSMRAWGFGTRDSARASLQALQDTWTQRRIRVRLSWQDALLDDTVTQAHIKALLGDFWVVRGTGGALQIDPAWKSAHIAKVNLPLVGPLRCNAVVAVAAAVALQELQDTGLSALVHSGDTRAHGGCFSTRETRSLNGNSGHNLSRHTWGAAIDINPSQNPYGGVSRMDGRVIDAFRRHGFIWGGSFIVPDPMHFEYVGQ